MREPASMGMTRKEENEFFLLPVFSKTSFSVYFFNFSDWVFVLF